jgi:hypothetical protein
MSTCRRWEGGEREREKAGAGTKTPEEKTGGRIKGEGRHQGNTW